MATSDAKFDEKFRSWGGDADFGVPAEVIGHPARSAMLLALLDGRALPMSMLASEAGVAASTASEHLTRLVDAGLLRVRREGRHRYYELASAGVVEALEALSRLAPPRPVRSLRSGTRAQALREARTCYDHIAGHLGVALLGSLLGQGAVTGGDGEHHPVPEAADTLAAAGKDVSYEVTESGWALLGRLEVTMPTTRRRLTGYCVDWTEQRHHLAGAVGAALRSRLEQLGWLQTGAKGHRRALTVTSAGREGFADWFGIDATSLATPRAA
jgi:DNA-binding transcriptional ArsR family regulator